MRMNELTRFPLSLFTIHETTTKGMGLAKLVGEEYPIELDYSPTL
jgi:hypothetical protein